MKTTCFLVPAPQLDIGRYKTKPSFYINEVLGRGQYNGYVGIDKETWNKYIQVDDYDDLPNSFPQPHGGITYISDKVTIGKSCIIPIDKTFDVNLEDYIIVGFDTLHCGDNYFKWDFESTKKELFRWRNEVINWFNARTDC